MDTPPIFLAPLTPPPPPHPPFLTSKELSEQTLSPHLTRHRRACWWRRFLNVKVVFKIAERFADSRQFEREPETTDDVSDTLPSMPRVIIWSQPASLSEPCKNGGTRTERHLWWMRPAQAALRPLLRGSPEKKQDVTKRAYNGRREKEELAVEAQKLKKRFSPEKLHHILSHGHTLLPPSCSVS